MTATTFIIQPNILKAVIGYYLGSNSLTEVFRHFPWSDDYKNIKGMPGIMALWEEYTEACNHKFDDPGSFFQVFFSTDHLEAALENGDMEARFEKVLLDTAADMVGEEITRHYPVSR